jgi:hypothetical protein
MWPPDDVTAFYRFLCEKFLAKGRRTLCQTADPACMKAFRDAGQERIKMYFLQEGEHIVGAHVICEYRDRSALWLGSASGHYNEHMRWELIKLEKVRGMKVLEIPDADARCVLPFNAKFNPRLQPRFTISRRDMPGPVAERTLAQLAKARV